MFVSSLATAPKCLCIPGRHCCARSWYAVSRSTQSVSLVNRRHTDNAHRYSCFPLLQASYSCTERTGPHHIYIRHWTFPTVHGIDYSSCLLITSVSNTLLH